MKLLVIGHARHGKDTVAELLKETYGLTYQSSSWAALEIFLFDQLQARGYGYKSRKECFEDRVNHRQLWKDLITRYNTPDKARLCRDILFRNGNNMYVGMRCPEEYAASKHLFDHILWVDALKRLPKDPTMQIPRDPDMIVIDNNGDLDHLRHQIRGAVSV